MKRTFLAGDGLSALPICATLTMGVDVADGLPVKRKKTELKPIDEEVQGPDRRLMERLRELYDGSGWASLREFSDAIGRVRARKLGSTLEDMPQLKADVGTLSYYMRGGGKSGARDRSRRVTEEFLYELFEALEEDRANGQAGLTDELRADTLRLYVEAIRPTQPVRARLLELQAQHKALEDQYEGLRQLVEDLRDDLEQARVERDAVDEQNKLLREQSDLDSAALRANEERRAALTTKIEELKSDLSEAQQERDRIRREYEELKGEMRAALEAAAVERQVLVEQHEVEAKDQLALLLQAQQTLWAEQDRRQAVEAQLQSVYQELTAPPSKEPEPGPAARPPQIEDVAATIEQLHAPRADESSIITRLHKLLRTFPQMEDQAIEWLCGYVRSVRGVERVRGRWVREGRSALDLIISLLSHPNAARTSADLSGTDLSFMTFQDRDLRYVRLSRCRLERVNFRGTDLSNADLSGASVSDANFTGATLHGTKLVGTTGLTLEALTDTRVDKNTTLPNNLTLVRRSFGRWALAEHGRSTLFDQTAVPGPMAEPSPPASVGQLLRAARTQQGYSLADVSARLGVAEGLLSRIEADDPRSLEFREVVTAFAGDVGADPLKAMAFLKRQTKSPIDLLAEESQPGHRT
jgi:uncharacterized protein YjbI with pentapeptide repeats